MKKVTLENYKKDKYYSKIVNAFSIILLSNDYISPILIFKTMNFIENKDIENWEQGKITYLEKVIHCNLSKANRILQIISFHAHDLNMKRSIETYKRKVKGKTLPLKFSKTGESNLEKAYSTHFINMKKNNKTLLWTCPLNFL